MEQENEQVRIRDLLKSNPKGLTIEEVSKKLSLNRATAAKYLTTLMLSGQAELRELGRAKIYYLSQRLPFTHLLSLSSDLILILDRDLFIQEVNEPFLSCFELNRDDLKGKTIEHTPLASFFSPDHLASIRKALDGTEVSCDVRFETTESERYFRMKLIPLVFEGGGQAVGVILEDISEMMRYQLLLENRIQERTAALVKTNDALQRKVEDHRRAERALRENEAVLRSMLDATPVGVGLVVDRVLKKVNNSLCDITGYTQEELTGQSTRMLYRDEEEYSRIDRELYNNIAGKGVASLEAKIRRKDGRLVDVIFSLSPFDPENPSSGLTATIVDVTERKRAEESLKRAGSQVALLTSITRHDILNQLTLLRGYLSHMRKQEITETMADLIRKEESIAETIRNQIIFTRDYRNVGVYPPDWIGIPETITTLQQTMPLGSVSLRADIGDLEIYADPLIEKVFSNLIETSTRHGKHVTGIHLSFRHEGKDLLLVYEDDGAGIPDEEKDLIFSREYTKTSGYRMLLIREILSITGLTIRETGVFGKGARFEIRVPEGSYRFGGDRSQNPGIGYLE